MPNCIGGEGWAGWPDLGGRNSPAPFLWVRPGLGPWASSHRAAVPRGELHPPTGNRSESGYSAHRHSESWGSRNSGETKPSRRNLRDTVKGDDARVSEPRARTGQQMNAHFFLPFPSSDPNAEVIGLAASEGKVYSGCEEPSPMALRLLPTRRRSTSTARIMLRSSDVRMARRCYGIRWQVRRRSSPMVW